MFVCRMDKDGPAFADPKIAAEKYLNDKKIIPMIEVPPHCPGPRCSGWRSLQSHQGRAQGLATSVLYFKPDNVRAFLVQELERYKDCTSRQEAVRAAITPPFGTDRAGPRLPALKPKLATSATRPLACRSIRSSRKRTCARCS